MDLEDEGQKLRCIHYEMDRELQPLSKGTRVKVRANVRITRARNSLKCKGLGTKFYKKVALLFLFPNPVVLKVVCCAGDRARPVGREYPGLWRAGRGRQRGPSSPEVN